MLNWLKTALLKIGKWLVNPSGWQYRHFWISPFGVSAATLTWSSQWAIWPDWSKVAEMAGLGVISYGVIAVAVEGGLIGMWYALSKIGRDLEERRRRRQEEAAGHFVAAIKAVESVRTGRASYRRRRQRSAKDTLIAVAQEAGVALPGVRRNRRGRRTLPTPTN